jgi:uncharacterized DUF497 family protein
MKTKVAGYEWDNGNGPKCGKHGVSQAETEQVLRAAPLVRPDRHPQDAETRFNAVGKNASGRHVFVVFTLRDKQGKRFVRPISARYMHAREIENYER